MQKSLVFFTPNGKSRHPSRIFPGGRVNPGMTKPLHQVQNDRTMRNTNPAEVEKGKSRKQKRSATTRLPTFRVSEMRFELTRANAHYPLKVACLPIPPPGHTIPLIYLVPRTGLEPACLSTHAPETCASTNSATWAFLFIDRDTDGAKNGTRTRDPNLGKVVLYQLSYFRIS